MLVDLRGNAVGRQDEHRALGDVAFVLHEHGTLRLEVMDDVDVVHDLLADVYGGTVDAQGPLDRVHGPLHSGTVAPWPGEKDAVGHGFMVPLGMLRPARSTNSPRLASHIRTGPPG